MFKKFFGKKNDGFYMQVDESAPPKVPAAPKEAAKPEANAAKESVSAPTVTAPTVAVPSAAISSAVAVVETPVEQKNDKKANSAKTSIKKDKKQDKKEVVQPEVAAVAAPAFTNFATDYLVTPAVAGSRRRPGANMKGFMSMARDVKEMKKGSQGNQQKEKAAKKIEA